MRIKDSLSFQQWSVMRSFSAATLCVAGLLLPLHSSAQQDAARIGVILPLSGSLAKESERIKAGMQAVIKQGTIRPAPQLTIEDEGCDPKQTYTAAQQLVNARVAVVVAASCGAPDALRVITDAGIPLISLSPRRLGFSSPLLLEFATVGRPAAEQLASKLSGGGTLKIAGFSNCWFSHKPEVPSNYDAALCPIMNIPETGLRQAERQFGVPGTPESLLGVSAMQAALQLITPKDQTLATMRTGRAVSLTTLMGQVPQANVPESNAPTLVLVFGAHPEASRMLDPLKQRQLDAIEKDSGCGCKKSSDCPQGMALLTAVQNQPCCKKNNDCPQGLIRFR